jgi:hypothetical protein
MTARNLRLLSYLSMGRGGGGEGQIVDIKKDGNSSDAHKVAGLADKDVSSCAFNGSACSTSNAQPVLVRCLQ